MTITNKLKTIAKTQISHIIQRIPVSDLRSILAPRGVLIFESERESHLHSLSVLHSDLKRMFNTGEAESYRESDNDYSTFEFDVYLTASLNLVDDLWIPGEEPPAVDAQRNLESAIQAWNAQHGTELLTIDESELSELQEKALKWDSRGLLTEERDALKDEILDLKRIIDTAREREGHLHDQIEKLEQDDRSLVIEELSHKLQTLNDYLDEAKYEHNRVVGDKLDTVGVCLDEARSLLTHR